MARLDPSRAYRPVARALHWTVAVIVLGMIPAGLVMTQQGLNKGLQDTLFIAHKNLGVIVLILMVLRLIYRSAYPPPPLPSSVPEVQQRLADFSHAMLYLAVITMAVSGYVRVVAGGFPLEVFDALGVPRLLAKNEAVATVAGQVHFVTHFVVIGLIALHICAALFHLIVKRDRVFARMWPALGG